MPKLPDRIVEELKVTHQASGATSVTCLLTSGPHKVSWSVKCYVSTIKEGVADARRGAHDALEELREAADGNSEAA